MKSMRPISLLKHFLYAINITTFIDNEKLRTCFRRLDLKQRFVNMNGAIYVPISGTNLKFTWTIYNTSVTFLDLSVSISEPNPEERAQRIAKAVLKQSTEVKENWEQLKIHASNWQKQVEKALEKLQELQKALDDLEAHVITAEGVHTDWQPVGDLLIDSLQDHIDKTKISAITLHFTYEQM
ncbi:utrophin-like [Stegostoma tigrinum]|uniref:utrophin-like n=1 Tax=Stegostoma tigrinum TaxID=3053191 RepID=UPI0028706764|nr:utrophin-like [Stegostoma tigrinum]